MKSLGVRVKGPIHLKGMRPRDPTIPIAPKAAAKPKRQEPEHEYQISLVKHLTLVIGPPGNSHNEDGVSWRAFDQGQKRSIIVTARDGTQKRINPEAAKAKARGVRRGVTDFWFRWPGALAWIELKAETDTSDDQDDFMSLQASYGDHVAVFRAEQGIEPVEAWLRACGCPMRRTWW